MFSLIFMLWFGVLVGLLLGVVSWWVIVWGFSLSAVLAVLIGFVSVEVSSCEFGGVFCYDEISCGLVWLSLFISGLSLLGSMDILVSGDKSEMFLVAVVSLSSVLCVCFSVDSLLLFYIFFEFSLVPILVIICGWGYQPERLRSIKYMVLYTVGASLPLLVLVFLLSIYSVSDKFSLLYAMRGVCPCGSMVLLASMMAFLVKSPAYGVHGWLPKAHVEAPVAGSMFLAGVLLKLGGYGLIRFYSILNLSSGVVFICLMCLCIFGGVVASVVCCAQADAKSLVAYSSVGHMSLVLGGLMSGSYWGLGGGYLLMIAHGLSSSGMFYLIGELYKMYSSRMLFVIRGGVGSLFGINLWLAFMSGFSASAPPSLSLCSEVMLCICLVSYSLWFSFFVGALGFLSCLYSWGLYCSTQTGNYPLWSYSNVSVSCWYQQGVVCVSLILPLMGLSACCDIGKFF
uniref:NADH-ubiquinone oxidoreductase chain 4 n=1 Tax=Pilsbryoconcha exilis TaxID=178825 RepID=A0A513X0I4_9BIVA|nr:NADH dehydrogenase subunit 4 [Pilsbryoconcha exilis]